MSFRYHGNYVGPGWSAGKYRASVRHSNVPPVDEFDRTAKEHDMRYAIGKRLKAADYKFYRQNIGRGIKRSVAALAVGFQGYLRRPDEVFHSSSSNVMQTPPKSGRRGRSMTRRSSSSRSYVRVPTMSSSGSRRSAMSISGRSLASAKSLTRQRSKSAVKTVVKKIYQSANSGGKFAKGGKSLPVDTKYAKFGVVEVKEQGGLLQADGLGGTAEQCLYLGHATLPDNMVRMAVWRAVVKMILMNIGIQIEDFRAPILTYTSASASYLLDFFYSTSEFVRTSVQYELTSSKTPDSLATELYSNTSFRTSTDIRFERVVIRQKNTIGGTETITVKDIDLSRAMIHYYSKSTLKIQNRSVSSADNNEADDVDNVPLFGKSYEGKGTGAIYRRQEDSTLPFCCQDDTGIISPHPISVIAGQYSLNEPPNPKMFQYVSRNGSAHLEPGQIKTSALVTKKSSTLTMLLQKLNSFRVVGSSVFFLDRSYKPHGQFRFFALEKMIQAVATTEVNKIRLAYECNLKLGAYCTAKRVLPTTYVVGVTPQ